MVWVAHYQFNSRASQRADPLLHSLVRYPLLQKIIRETKLSYLGGLLLGNVIKLLLIIYPRTDGARLYCMQEQAHCLWR